MRFINQFFRVVKIGLVLNRQRTAADDGNVAEYIFVRLGFWSASGFDFSFRNATRVPAAGNL
jgi:hypothetical protein